jgi:hypothetical protein
VVDVDVFWLINAVVSLSNYRSPGADESHRHTATLPKRTEPEASRFARSFLVQCRFVRATGVCSTQIVSGSTASRSPPSRSSSPRLRSLFSKLHKIGIL